MDWKECKDKKFVKEISEDISLINSLVGSSNKKLQTSKRIELDEVTASTKVSTVHDSLREILEALAIKKGFKIYNHECFCSFLYEVCKDKSSSAEFDKFRKIRNQINYYGKNVSKRDAEILIRGIIKLRDFILKKYF